MNTATRKNDAEKKTVKTLGDIFSDGTIIELVCGPPDSDKPHVLLWNGKAAKISSQTRHGNHFYEAAEIPPGIYRATRFPARYSAYDSVRQLLNRVEKLFGEHLHFAESESRLLGAFALSTWVTDHLPSAPTLLISGPDERSGVEVLKLLNCVCRRPLLLAEVTPAGFRSLPMHLSLTLLINQPALRPAMLRLLGVSRYRGMHVLGNRGTLIDVYGPTAILCGNEALDSFNETAIQISTTQAGVGWTTLDEQFQDKIADEFQPQLLAYRLNNVANLRTLEVGNENFSAATGQLASILSSSLSEDPELARETVRLLRPQDEDLRAQQQLDVNRSLVEILWGLVHHGGLGKAISVDELTKMVNTLLQSRGGEFVYSAEELGWKLRASGIPRHKSSAGREVVFDSANRQRIHQLARAYAFTCERISGCRECSLRESAVP